MREVLFAEHVTQTFFGYGFERDVALESGKVVVFSFSVGGN